MKTEKNVDKILAKDNDKGELTSEEKRGAIGAAVALMAKDYKSRKK